MSKADMKKEGDAKRDAWMKNAPDSLTVTIDGQTVVATKKLFSTGSVGYNLSGKVVVNGDKMQVGMNLTVVGSKEWGND